MVLPLRAAEVQRPLVVVTSFPASLYEPFRRAFEERHPDIKLQIVNRKTTAAIAMVADGRFAGADVFWASSPDAFEVLAARDLLLPLPPVAQRRHEQIGPFPVDDPAGRFRGFSVSGYGLTWNMAVLQARGLSPPRSIRQLTDPDYRGLVAMSAPSRSGTTHLMVETVLQRYGWEEGWALWLRLAGNLATITARSFSVGAGVAQGRFGIGLSIDFLGRTAANERPGFAYPRENVFLPASIAVLREGRNAEAAGRFVAFVLGSDGQALLAHPRIARHPVLEGSKGSDGEDIFALARESDDPFLFDARLSGRRYELVNILFDELITDRLARIQRFWKRQAELHHKAAGQPALVASAMEAAELAGRLPDGLLGLDRLAIAETLRRLPRGVPAPPEQAALIGRIRADVDLQFAAAEARLDALQAKLGGEPGVRTGGTP